MAFGKKRLFLICALVAGCTGGFFVYLNAAFPETRCAGAHLAAPEKYADCVSCHTAVTPKVVQNWTESKHGILLVKCVVCHGEPDGQGSIPFAVDPNPRLICASCHDSAMTTMQAKYGNDLSCNSCHSNHQNSIHRSKAFDAVQAATKTSF
jgi:uncharacterized CHY-type Zn-finger protein